MVSAAHKAAGSHPEDLVIATVAGFPSDKHLPLIEGSPVSAEDRTAAIGALLAAGRRLSLVDCVSFTVMRRLGIREYLGLDPHFEEQGFTPHAAAG